MLVKVIIGFLIGVPVSILADWYCSLFEAQMMNEPRVGRGPESGINVRQMIRDGLKGRAQVIMVVSAVGFGCIAYYVEGWLQFSIVALFFSVVLIVSLVDLRTYMIPDSVLILGAVMGIPLLLWSQGMAWALPAALGVLTGGGLLLLIVVITKGGMGGGDVKLAAFMGVFLGFQGILTAFFIAFTTGGLYGVFLILSRRKKKGDEIPFGPFLALGGIIAAMASQSLFKWYLSVLAG